MWSNYLKAHGHAEAQPEDLLQDPSNQDLVRGICNELLKSYGFKTDADGKTEWSVENIQQAFKDEPFWTTLDYATLGLGPAKTLVAGGKVAKGAGAVGKAYKAGEYGEGLGAFRRATRAQQTEGWLKGRVGRHITNPARFQHGDDYIEAVKKYGSRDNVYEQWGLKQAFKNDYAYQRAAVKAEAKRFGKQRAALKLTKEQDENFAKMLHNRQFDPTVRQSAGTAAVRAALGSDEAVQVFDNTAAWRNSIHDQLHDLDILNTDTWLKHKNQWNRRVYEEYLDADQKAKVGGQLVKKAKSDKNAAGAKLKARMAESERQALIKDDKLHEIFDAKTSIESLAGAASLAASQRYARALANSAVSRPSRVILNSLSRHIDETPRSAWGALGLTDEAADAIKMVDPSDVDAVDEALGAAGWIKLDKALPNLPSYMKRVAHHFDGRYVQADALDGITQAMGALEPEILKTFHHFSKTMTNMPGMQAFRVVKTVLNAATWGRNWMGNVFNLMGAGLKPTFVPRRGLKAFREDGAEWAEVVRAGIVEGSTWTDELLRKETLTLADELAMVGDTGVETSAMHGVNKAIGWLTSIASPKAGKAVTEGLESATLRAQRGYAAIDQLFKAELYFQKKDKYARQLARGGTVTDDILEKASIAAKSDVVKFTPTFNRASPMTDWMRGVIPFQSFTNEQMRVWSNVLRERPMNFFALAHLGDVMSEFSAAAVGMSPDQLQAAREGLPDFTDGRMMTVLPFKADNKLQFLDLSYMMPLANLGADVQASEKVFFGAFASPSANPYLNVGAAFVTGIDPFSKRPVGPRFTEEQLGVRVQGETPRFAVGMAEHIISTFAPPIVPPGYTGTNLLEAVKGTKHYYTGDELEPSLVKTIAANLFGLRTYESSLRQQSLNARYEISGIQDEISIERRRWQRAIANNDPAAAKAAEDGIRALRRKLYPDKDPEDYIEHLRKTQKPGTDRMTRRQRELAVERAEKIRDQLKPEELEQLEDLKAKLK